MAVFTYVCRWESLGKAQNMENIENVRAAPGAPGGPPCAAVAALIGRKGPYECLGGPAGRGGPVAGPHRAQIAALASRLPPAHPLRRSAGPLTGQGCVRDTLCTIGGLGSAHGASGGAAGAERPPAERV